MHILKQFFFVVAYLVGILLLLIVVLAAIIQTDFFKDRLRVLLASTLSQQINGVIQLGNIGGNFLTEITIDSLGLYYNNEPFVSTGTISISHDPFALLEKRVSIDKLVVDSLSVRFLRSTDDKWNCNEIFKTPEETTAPKPFDWTIKVENLELRNATVSLLDSLAIASPKYATSPQQFLQYHNFTVNDIELSLNAEFSDNDFEVQITSLSFYSQSPEFQLKKFKANLHASKTGLKAKNLIIQTNRSYLEIDAGIKNLDIFRGIFLEQMKNDTTYIRLKADVIDFAELKTFIEDVHFLEGAAFIDLDAAGTFGDLAIHKLDVQTYKSSLNFVGKVQNLHRPHDLSLDVYIDGSKIDPSDAAKLLPRFKMPNFSEVGQTVLFARYTGKPLDFSTVVLAEGSFGSFEIGGSLNLIAEQPTYEAKFSCVGLNLAPLTEYPDLKSSLFVRGKLEGKGFSTKTLSTNLNATVDSAVIKNYIFTRSTVNVAASSEILNLKANLHSSAMNLATRTTFNLKDFEIPRFESEFHINSLDLAKVLQDNEYQSNIAVRGTINGSGSSLDNISLQTDLILLPSRIRTHSINEEHIAFDLDQSNPNKKRLFVQSSLADIEIGGKFNFDILTSVLPVHIKNLEHSIKYHTQENDTSFKIPYTSQVGKKEYDFAFFCNVKNLELISAIWNKLPFNAYGIVQGAVRGTEKQLSLTANGAIEEFFIGNIQSGALLEKGNIYINLNNLTHPKTLENLTGSATVTIGTMIVKQTKINNSSISMGYNDSRGVLAFEGLLDSLFTISTNCILDVQPQQYAFAIPTFLFKRDTYAITNHDTIRFKLDQWGLTFTTAELKSNNDLVKFIGTISDSENTNLQITLQGFELADISHWFKDTHTQEEMRKFAGFIDANIIFSRGLRAPAFVAKVNGQNLRYKETSIGASHFTVSYTDANAIIDGKIKRSETDDSPYLSISGTIPIDLSIGAKERFPDRKQKIEIYSEGFELGLFDPLLKDVEQMSGIVTCDMQITGTPRSPEYLGAVSIRDGNFLFLPNYVHYSLSGNLEPSENRIALKNFTIKSVTEEKREAISHLSGTITIKDFKIEMIDLTITGEMVLMTAATRKRIQSMYGTLYTSTDKTGIRISGNLEQPFLNGTLYIRNANLIFPPTKEHSITPTTHLLPPPIVIDDTTKVQHKLTTLSEQFYQIADTTSISSRDAELAMVSPLLSRLQYDLNIATEGETRIRMIFSPATNEELYAELEGQVNAVNTGGTPSLYGQISVLDRSYYNFLKRFDAVGKLKFVGHWDNPELDITATYEGVHTEPEQSTTLTEQKTKERKVFVILDITGTRHQPKLNMSMKVEPEQGKEPEDWALHTKGGDIQSDAISFVLTGKFRDELTSADKENIASSWGTTAGTGFTSTFLSSILTEFLRKEFTFIRSAEIIYRGGNLQESADLRLSGVAGKGYWRFGGKIFHSLGNANVSYQLSLGEMFNAPSIKNLFVELERKVEGSDTIEEYRKLTNTARLYYRFTF